MALIFLDGNMLIFKVFSDLVMAKVIKVIKLILLLFLKIIKLYLILCNKLYIKINYTIRVNNM